MPVRAEQARTSLSDEPLGRAGSRTSLSDEPHFHLQVDVLDLDLDFDQSSQIES